MACSISPSVAIPVEITMGLPVRATCARSGRLVMSIEAILMNGTSSPASMSASAGANALEENAIPRARAWSLAMTCCSGVSW